MNRFFVLIFCVQTLLLGAGEGLVQAQEKTSEDYAGFRDLIRSSADNAQWRVVEKDLPSDNPDIEKYLKGYLDGGTLQYLVEGSVLTENDSDLTFYFWNDGELISILRSRTGKMTEDSKAQKETRDVYNFSDGMLVEFSRVPGGIVKDENGLYAKTAEAWQKKVEDLQAQILAEAGVDKSSVQDGGIPEGFDLTVVVGERVGGIKKGATLASLQALFGTSNVIDGVIPGPEGTTLLGATLFQGSPREVEVIWKQQEPAAKAPVKEVERVVIQGPAWQFENGLKFDLPMEEVEKINGKAFKISGFDWDYGGWANFEGGKLEHGVGVRFYPSADQYSDTLGGEKQISTADKNLREAKPTITELSVIF